MGLSGVLSHCKANLEKPGHHLRLSEERNIIKLAKAEEENIDTDTAVSIILEQLDDLGWRENEGIPTSRSSFR